MLKNLAALCISLVLTFLVGELVLRGLGYRGEVGWEMADLVKVNDPVLTYRLKPDSTTFAGDVVYQLNRNGFRGDNHTYMKEDRARLLVIGDSVAFGYKVRFEEVFSQQLEQLLAARYNESRVEVITLAMPGLNTLQEGHLLVTEGSKYDPDLIVVAYSLNDAEAGIAFSDEKKTCRIELIGLPFPCALKTSLKRSALLYFVKDRVDQLMWRVGVGDEDDVYHSIGSDYFNGLYRDERQWREHVVSGFETIGAFSRERNIPVVVVIFPVMYDFKTYKWEWIHERVKQEAKRHSFQVVDLLDDFKQYPVDSVRVERGDFVHPNGLGHRLAAVAVERALQNDAGSGSSPSRASRILSSPASRAGGGAL